MLEIFGRPQRVCDGFARRNLLQACGAGLLGATLPKLFAAEEAGGLLPARSLSCSYTSTVVQVSMRRGT